MSRTAEFICANWDPDGLHPADCKRTGKHTCSNCFLVVYCGPACQKAHWSQHRNECKSALNKDSWEPAWALENREPEFMGRNGGVAAPFGGKKYLWGNTPALDILRLGSNEGNEYDGDLRMLFAASGDIRNVTKTIAQLLSSYSRPLEITINDRDFDVVGRNIILLLVALVVDKADEAIDCMMHIWYSAMLRQSDIDFLQHRVRPLIGSVCSQTKDKRPGIMLGKTWTFGQKSLRVVLEKKSWDRLLSLIDGPAGLSGENARKIRKDITQAESRRDYRERHMYCMPPPHRLAFNKFREDGILLPFGYSRDEFQVPNPTLFRDANTWNMNDNADPLHGWSPEDIANTSSGAATADIYGKLFFHIRGVLRAFLNRIASVNSSFTLYQLDALDLPKHLEKNTFSRIEVSNISDAGWLGLRKTLQSMVPLLQPHLENPHATLITLFMNAVEETLIEKDTEAPDTLERSRKLAKLQKYLPTKRAPNSEWDPEVIKSYTGWTLLTTYDHVFDRYARQYHFSKTSAFYGAEMKKNNTIIDKWPYRLKLELGQTGAQEEFDRYMGAGTSGKECYVEWKRVHREI